VAPPKRGLSGAYSELGRASNPVVAGRRKKRLIENLDTRYKKLCLVVQTDAIENLSFLTFNFILSLYFSSFVLLFLPYTFLPLYLFSFLF
jgi:hypothetical protein